MITFSAVTVIEEWFLGRRGVDTAPAKTGLSAWWRLVNGNRPRHGGYIVHLALLTLSLGVVGTQFFDQRMDIALRPGESAIIDDYRIEYVNRNSALRSDRVAQWADLNIYRIDPGTYDGGPGGTSNRAAKVRVRLSRRRPHRRAPALARILHRLQPGLRQGRHPLRPHRRPLRDTQRLPHRRPRAAAHQHQPAGGLALDCRPDIRHRHHLRPMAPASRWSGDPEQRPVGLI